MEFYSNDIYEQTQDNNNYRKVIYTVPNSFQLVLMTLQPYEKIGGEIHPHTTQYVHVVEGLAVAYISNSFYVMKKNSVVVIPPGTSHNIRNISSNKELKLYTIYTPPEHERGKVQKTK